MCGPAGALMMRYWPRESVKLTSRVPSSETSADATGMPPSRAVTRPSISAAEIDSSCAAAGDPNDSAIAPRQGAQYAIRTHAARRSP